MYAESCAELISYMRAIFFVLPFLSIPNVKIKRQPSAKFRPREGRSSNVVPLPLGAALLISQAYWTPRKELPFTKDLIQSFCN